jgi:hypothetical protein
MIIRAITQGKKGYKVYFDTGKLLILECMDEQYAGISTWADYWGVNDATIEEGYIFREKIINSPDLPSMVKNQIEKLLYEIEEK